MIAQIIKIIKILNANENPAQLALALSLAMVLAFTPTFNLHNLIVIFFVCVLRINLGMFVLSFTVLSGVAWLLDPSFEKLGARILLNPDWSSLWTQMYQNDIWRLAHFNNTLTMGSVAVSMALLIPSYLISYWLIARYRDTVLAWIAKTRLMKALKASKWYQRFHDAYQISEAVS